MIVIGVTQAWWRRLVLAAVLVVAPPAAIVIMWVTRKHPDWLRHAGSGRRMCAYV